MTCARPVLQHLPASPLLSEVRCKSSPTGLMLGPSPSSQVRYSQRQVWLIPTADERVGMQVKDPLRARATREHFCSGVSLQIGTMSSICTFTFV